MLRCFATQSLEASGCVLKISRFAGDRNFVAAHFFYCRLPMSGHIGVALLQAEIGMADGFAQGLRAVSKDKGFSEMLVSVVCHVCLLLMCVVECTMEAEWGMNFTTV
jgi:hypothetical protein